MKMVLLVVLVPIVVILAVNAILRVHIPLNFTTWGIGAVMTLLAVKK